MAIGNAPWPIGVTMVGIHARTGREKIFSKHVAHVLNDETQRKYIQVRLWFCLPVLPFSVICFSDVVIRFSIQQLNKSKSPLSKEKKLN